jgi:hypothetical protein
MTSQNDMIKAIIDKLTPKEKREIITEHFYFMNSFDLVMRYKKVTETDRKQTR